MSHSTQFFRRYINSAVLDVFTSAHSRQKFFDLYANHQSQLAAAALPFYSHLYQIEKQAMDLTADE